MAARKSRMSRARTPGDRPVLGDMLLSQADVPDRDDPPVQLDLPRNFFVIDHSRQAQVRRGASTALVPMRGGGGALTIDHPGAVFGHLGGALEAIPLPKAASGTPKDSNRSVRGGAACPLPRARRDCRRRRSCAVATACACSRSTFFRRTAGRSTIPTATPGGSSPLLRVEQCVVAELGVVGIGGPGEPQRHPYRQPRGAVEQRLELEGAVRAGLRTTARRCTAPAPRRGSPACGLQGSRPGRRHRRHALAQRRSATSLGYFG